MHKECVKCKGEFQRREQIYLDILNQSYCEVCYKEEQTGNVQSKE